MRHSLAAVSIFVLLAAACDSGSDSPTAPLAARVAFSVSPSPITVRNCADCPHVGELDFEAEFVFIESAGTAAQLVGLSGVLRADAGNRVVLSGELPLNQGDLAIPAGGTLRHRFLLHFPGEDQPVPATFDLTARILVSESRSSEVTTSVRLLPPA
jgi:hypothetical protein